MSARKRSSSPSTAVPSGGSPDRRRSAPVARSPQSLLSSGLPTSLQSADLTNSRIADFEGLHFFSALIRLTLDGNPIRSFVGALPLPRLRFLSLNRTPLSRARYFRLMCVVAFGGQLRILNGRCIPCADHSRASVLCDSLLPALQNGALLWGLNPVRLVSFRSNSPIRPPPGLLAASLSPAVCAYASRRARGQAAALGVSSPPARPSAACACGRLLSGGASVSPTLAGKFMGGLEALRRARPFPRMDLASAEDDAADAELSAPSYSSSTYPSTSYYPESEEEEKAQKEKAPLPGREEEEEEEEEEEDREKRASSDQPLVDAEVQADD
jgi:hypothetical protein